MPHRFQTALATLFVAALAGATAGSAQPARQTSVDVDGAPPVNLAVVSDRNDAVVTRLSDTASTAIRRFAEWFGPLDPPTITVVDLPWRASPSEASLAADVVPTRVHWLTPERDVTAERSMVAGVARQFWRGSDTGGDASFREGLAIFAATRGIHDVLAGRNFAAPRLFGGFLSLPLRSLQLSPNLVGPRPLLDEFDEIIQPAEASWRFASTADGSPARRTAMALQTLERTIGWPATQQALAELRSRAAGGPLSRDMLAAVLAEQRGVAMEWFVREVVRSTQPIDYAVGAIESATTAGEVKTTVTIERRGSGVYSGTDQPRSAGPARSIRVLARFADGSDSDAYVDGRDASTEITWTSHTPVASIMVDPAGLLLSDANRSNNGRMLSAAPVDRTGLRLVMNWVIWLQNAMLTYAATV